VRTLKLGSSATASHVVMELLRGSTLREVLAHRTALDVPAAVAVMVPVLAALHAAHAADVCHGDLKPENVVLEPDGAEDVVVKVLDLGGLPPAGEGDAVVGSAGYLSPEQAAGEVVDARSDVFGAGVLLFELVTGRPPFAAATPVATAYQIVHRPAPRVEDVRLAPLLDVAMAKAPADRFATAALFAQALADRVPPAALRDLRVARGA
jgi:serine/threonine-protein kinase